MCNTKELYFIVPELIESISANREYLSKIDGEIGDGDHGINMSKGFLLCKEILDPEKDTLSDAFSKLSEVLMFEIGGSMGPLYGMFFEGMSDACKGVLDMNLELLCNMVSKGLEGVIEIGEAKKGDKTLLDALIPAKESLEKSINENLPFEQALENFKKASFEGKESTRDMVAKVGRASRLGERSRDVLDAGATSCNLILNSMADSILKIL